MDKNEWLFDDISGLKEKIRFKDRIEYRVSGELHNQVGSALISFSIENGEKIDEKYYLKGQEYSVEDWEIKTRGTKIKKLKKKIKDKVDEENDN